MDTHVYHPTVRLKVVGDSTGGRGSRMGPIDHAVRFGQLGRTLTCWWTCPTWWGMSAVPPRADIEARTLNVRS